MARERTSGQKRNDKNGGDAVATAPPEPSPYRHYVKGEQPRLDAAYFELLLARVVHAGGGIGQFDEIWPRVVQALAGFNMLRLSTMTESEINDAIMSVGGDFEARLAGKTESLRTWAESFWRVRQIYGSFRQYVRSFDVDGFDSLLTDLNDRFPGLSTEFLVSYLRETGEKAPAQAAGKPGGQQRSRRGRGERTKGGGNSRRRPQKNGGTKTAATPPTVEQAKSQDATDSKSPNKNRRGRRRFFRRRGNRAKAPSSTSEA